MDLVLQNIGGPNKEKAVLHCDHMSYFFGVVVSQFGLKKQSVHFRVKFSHGRNISGS
jgi:hypothetical protein